MDMSTTKKKERKEKMERLIKVTGKGKISVKPDMIRLYITKEELRKEYEATLKASTDDTEFLKDLFMKLDRKSTRLNSSH